MVKAAKQEANVPFTRPNAKQCICWKCPVQAESACIKANAEKMGEVMSTKFFEPRIVPGLYCSSGVASCKDIKTERPCLCGACPVYAKYELAARQPRDHYCGSGAARFS